MQCESREGKVISMNRERLGVPFFVGCGWLGWKGEGTSWRIQYKIRKGGSDLALDLARGEQPCFTV